MARKRFRKRGNTMVEQLDPHLKQMMQEVRRLIDAKGFSSDESRIWEMLTLIHSEISEAADKYRKGADYEEVGEELIDALIRILHLFSTIKEDPDKLFIKVMKQNWERPNRWNTVRGG
jgi:NTP pyrophosphatase (non-canonical NTP hydrolase)